MYTEHFHTYPRLVFILILLLVIFLKAYFCILDTDEDGTQTNIDVSSLETLTTLVLNADNTNRRNSENFL